MKGPNTSTAADRTLALIENEKRRDRFIRWVSIIAWAATFSIVLIVAGMTAASVIEMRKLQLVGAVTWQAVMGAALPLIDVLWKLGLLVASLSTMAIFLRLRTSSLVEIQLRLSALEEMLASRSESSKE
jgi:hypothetical protein